LYMLLTPSQIDVLVASIGQDIGPT